MRRARGAPGALERVGAGGTALDPEVVMQGRSNTAIATHMAISPGAVEKHVASIFGKLGMPPCEGDNRRVLAVLQYLRT